MSINNGQIIKAFNSILFLDEHNSWHQRTVVWNEFSGDSNFNFNAIISMGFYTDRNNQNYTEVFRFDDIELFCNEGVQQNAILLSDVAKSIAKPKGAPNYSDVCLTSRYRRIASKQLLMNFIQPG